LNRACQSRKPPPPPRPALRTCPPLRAPFPTYDLLLYARVFNALIRHPTTTTAASRSCCRAAQLLTTDRSNTRTIQRVLTNNQPAFQNRTTLNSLCPKGEREAFVKTLPTIPIHDATSRLESLNRVQKYVDKDSCKPFFAEMDACVPRLSRTGCAHEMGRIKTCQMNTVALMETACFPAYKKLARAWDEGASAFDAAAVEFKQCVHEPPRYVAKLQQYLWHTGKESLNERQSNWEGSDWPVEEKKE
jgi:hypothetical protein